MAEQTPQESYDRGHAAGEVAGSVAEQLRRHDDHFRRINGSVDRVADELAALRAELAAERTASALAIQRILDTMTANVETVKTTAEALAAAEENRRRASETTWSPISRVLAVLGGVVAVVSLWIAWRATR